MNRERSDHSRNLRRLKAAVLLLALAAAGFFLLQGLREARTHALGLPLADAARFEALTEGRTPRAAEGSPLLFDGELAAYDAATATVYVAQSMQTDGWRGTLAARPEGFEAYLLADDAFGDKAAALREGRAFSLLLVSESEYIRASVVFTGLATVSITGAADDSPSAITVIDPDDRTREGGVFSAGCTFHVRGNLSATFDKKCYRLSLCDGDGEAVKRSLLGMRRDDDWILNALYSDSSRIREKLAWELWAEICREQRAPVAACGMEYVEVFLNDRYQGLYALQEPLDGKQLGMESGDMLFKVKDYGIPSREGFEAGLVNLMLIADGSIKAEIAYPNRAADGFDWTPFRDFCEAFVWKDGARFTSTDALAEVYDFTNLATYYGFCQLIAAEDNNWKNLELAAYLQDDGGWRCYETVWDMNFCFGDTEVDDPAAIYTVFSVPPDSDSAYSYSFDTLRELDPELADGLLLTLWKRWKSAGLNAEHVCTLAESYNDRLVSSGAMAREKALWPAAAGGSDLEDIEAWVAARFVWMDGVFAAMEE